MKGLATQTACYRTKNGYHVGKSSTSATWWRWIHRHRHQRLCERGGSPVDSRSACDRCPALHLRRQCLLATERKARKVARIRGLRGLLCCWPSITEWEVHITAQSCRLRNDLYCVEWDVKLYYTIPYQDSGSRDWNRYRYLPLCSESLEDWWWVTTVQ